MHFEDFYLIGVVAAFVALIVTLASVHVYVLLDPKPAAQVDHTQQETGVARRDLAA